MSTRALLYVNPHSRSGRERKAAAIAALANHDIEALDVSDVPASGLSDAVRRGRGDADRIIVGGGDGTLNRLLEPLVELGLPVGILPLGTANDLAATLRIPNNLDEACAVVSDGKMRRIDLGSVNGKYFVNEGSLGVSNQIVRGLDPGTKRRWGMIGIFGNAARVVSKARQFRAWLRCDEKTYNVSTLQITVGNGERFGGFIKSADADISDHRLDLYSLEVRNFLEVLELMPALVRGRYADCPGVRLERCREVEIRTERPRHIYTDGERTTATPAVFRLVPSALAVFTSSGQPGE